MEIFQYLALIFLWGGVSLIFWVPLIAVLLWALTLITTAITFNWLFVGVISGIAALITGIILAE